MARLEIRDPDDQTTRVLRVENGVPLPDPPDPQWVRELLELNVVSADGEMEQVTPKDGDRWLEGLQINYRGIYFRGVFVPE